MPNKYRFLSYALCAGTFLPVQALGPAIGEIHTLEFRYSSLKSFSKGRILCDQTEQGWRWIYYIVATIAFFTIILQLFCYFPPKFEQLHQGSSKRATLKHLDYIGIVILTGSTASLLLGISWGGQRYGMKLGDQHFFWEVKLHEPLLTSFATNSLAFRQRDRNHCCWRGRAYLLCPLG